MSNFIDYKEIMAFHPGYYVAEIIEDMGISQAEFALRMGTTAKTLSKLVNGRISISDDLAKKLSAMLGISVDFWLNIQKEFDKKVIEIEQQKDIDLQIEIAKVIDYSFFEKVANLPHVRSFADKVVNLCKYLKIANLSLLRKPDFLVNSRTGITTIDDKNIINAQAWLQTALNCASAIETSSFNSDKLESYLPEIKSMTLQNPQDFLPMLRSIFSECGVAFVLLPHLKNSGINGAVKWVNNKRVVLAMNDRRTYSDTFWFSLFHEIKHVLQQKVNSTFVASTSDEWHNYNKKLENDADSFAQNYLIPKSEYNNFISKGRFFDADIIGFSQSIGIHPGIVVGRLQHDKIIPVNRCSSLKSKYKIVIAK